MNYESVLWALSAPVASTQKLVLIGVAAHAMADGVTASITVANLAKIADVSGRSVTRAVGALVKQGLLDREINAGDADDAYARPNIYRLRIGRQNGGAR